MKSYEETTTTSLLTSVPYTYWRNFTEVNGLGYRFWFLIYPPTFWTTSRQAVWLELEEEEDFM